MRNFVISSIAVSLACVLTGCDRAPAGYVPGPEFKTVISLRAESATAKVGRPVKLSASRETSGWIEGVEADTRPEKCFMRSKPSDESEIAANLGWRVTPKGIANFDVPQNPLDASRNRHVTFSQPGEYRLKGHSALYCDGAWSNEITITVTE